MRKETNMDKRYYTMDGIGKCKYTVNWHDGVKTYKDGSPFFDIRIFSNKKKRNQFISQLISKGYQDKGMTIYD